MSEPVTLRPSALGFTSDDADPLARFRADLARFCDPDADRLLVAVSGGPDSLALLLLAHAAASDGLHAATVDHGLRTEARAEASMVAEVCARLGVPHAVLAGTPPPRVGGTGNLSARARALRYHLLEEHRLATGCTRVATAHHADDQAETLVMRLNRGAGLGGLAGIRLVTGRVIRPLLSWRRAELAALVAAAGLEPAFDASNVDDRYDRARLRRSLAVAEWLDVDRWGRSAAALAEAEDALAWVAERIAGERIKEGEACVLLTLDAEPAEIVRRLVLACLLRVDPHAGPRGGDVARLAERVRSAAASSVSIRATLGKVMVATRPGGDGRVFEFRPAPPRRPGGGT